MSNEHNQPSLRKWFGSPRPLLVTIVLVLIGGQLLLTTVYVGVGTFNLASGNVDHVGIALMMIVSAAGASWLLFALLRGIAHGQAWVRGPALTVQILVILVGVSLIQAKLYAFGAAAMAYGFLLAVLFFVPQVSQHIGFREPRQD
ncbi:hypothetical protein [Timonella sp. A28]|uniref:hypothetical protein n=1 Tax=Timonella sp. A28 TaxID=3442640 RepID=UPI003EBCBFEE